MNDALPVRWSALTHPVITILSGPTAIPVVDGPVAAEVGEPQTKRPAAVAVAVTTKRPVSATVLTSFRPNGAPSFR